MRSANRKIADQWRDAVMRSWEWRPARNQAGASNDYRPGEAGGLFVSCDDVPKRRAYMKPKKKEDNKFRAAREKIAADLAHDIGLCVPPVLLTQRNDANSREEENVCVSLVLYPRQWSWKQLRPQLVKDTEGDDIAGLARRAMLEAAGVALAFDTWVGQWDHGDHPHNIVFGYEPERLSEEHSFIFLDFAFSMGLDGRWNDQRYEVIEQARFPKLMLESIGPDELQRGLSLIEAIPDGDIEEVVDRIPDSHMNSSDRTLIKDALCYRKDKVRPALEVIGA